MRSDEEKETEFMSALRWISWKAGGSEEEKTKHHDNIFAYVDSLRAQLAEAERRGFEQFYAMLIAKLEVDYKPNSEQGSDKWKEACWFNRVIDISHALYGRWKRDQEAKKHEG
jgi:hypothetical protein